MCSRGLFWMKEGRQAVYRKWCERKHRCIIYQKDKSNHFKHFDNIVITVVQRKICKFPPDCRESQIN
jgi:hypothetical protein